MRTAPLTDLRPKTLPLAIRLLFTLTFCNVNVVELRENSGICLEDNKSVQVVLETFGLIHVNLLT